MRYLLAKSGLRESGQCCKGRPWAAIAVQDNQGYARMLASGSKVRSQVSMAREARANLAIVGLNGLAIAPIALSPGRGRWRTLPLTTLREGVTRDEARDVLFTYTRPEIYELLVLRQGWSLDDFARFIRQGIAAAVL